MASSVQQAPAANVSPTADVVGNAFVHQYYHILHQSPMLVHQFYQDISKLGRPQENGVMSITTTMQAINEKILSFDCGKLNADIKSVDAQESYNGGVFVLVTGYMTFDSSRRKFTQSFFLAPQDKGYFVLNDVFRFLDDAIHQNGNQGLVNDIEVSVTVKHDFPAVHENHVSETAVPNHVDGEEVYNPENGEISTEEEAPADEVIDEIPDDLVIVAESKSKIEEVPKKSYASIVKVLKESAGSFSAPTPAPSRPIRKNQGQQQTAAPTHASASEIVPSSISFNENGNNHETEGAADGHSIYVKGLPLNATTVLLENEFEKFGAIKAGGIQVRSLKGFCFGFVEFEMASSVRSAIEASPITINGRQVVVEEKRSTSRGNSRGRFSLARGNGYRSEGTKERGTGNYGGGRGYGRNDNSNRGDFGNRNSNRGGVPNRGGDAYHRSENSRMIRAGVLSVNPTTKSTEVHASA